MKVYIVEEFDYDGTKIHAVFKNRLDAEQYVNSNPDSKLWSYGKANEGSRILEIEEHEVQG